MTCYSFWFVRAHLRLLQVTAVVPAPIRHIHFESTPNSLIDPGLTLHPAMLPSLLTSRMYLAYCGLISVFSSCRRQWDLPAAADWGPSSKWDQAGLRIRQHPWLWLWAWCQHRPAGPRPPAEPLLQRLCPHLLPETHHWQGRCHLLRHRCLTADHVCGC